MDKNMNSDYVLSNINPFSIYQNRVVKRERMKERKNRFKEIYKHAYNFPCLKSKISKNNNKKICYVTLVIRKLAWLN